MPHRFNPHPRMGGDMYFRMEVLESSCRFNPHPRMGGDGERNGQANESSCFNPHPRMGGDSQGMTREEIIQVSIHTPVWGVTQVVHYNNRLYFVSIHTPVWGVTHCRPIPA